MKKFFITGTTGAFILLTTVFAPPLAIGQKADTNLRTGNRIIATVPLEGYWIIESNMHLPAINLVHFYNDSNVLIYREKVEGLALNAKKKKTRVQLNTVLQMAINAYNITRQATANSMWMMAGLQKR